MGKKGNAGASDGIRTHGIQDHNLALYQLSYARHTPRRAVYAEATRPVNGAAAKCAASRSSAASSTSGRLQKAKRA